MKTIKYNPVDFLDTCESRDTYLKSMVENGDPQMIASAVYNILLAQKKYDGCCRVDSNKLTEALCN